MSGLLLFWRISCHREELPSSLSHLRYRTPSLRCKGSQRVQSSSYCRTLRRDFLPRFVNAPNLGTSTELIGSFSCAFYISHEDQGSTVIVAKTCTEISVSTPNFFSSFVQCLQLSLQDLRERT
ncbi:hypothetical protein AVEN_95594-1 [Araneus ventricosus]|uniref:Uncharacterized protein n=1 Tax=Araneus ventricosus TaxID=182803 RepID=A0A4Y2G1F2_ARAVE|nr:hypothetical protein AVEN_95594-1 [Araneus ventricosus]